ncbi:uncharacterized protein L3040_006050 [Drepanopeziza brunnea f. sp. 'multigermtubi']|uniref:uncharacterized protein n=1 Tax=Drepanopeziza brunnea f. sp. 'multigermtubi' TaxID=698441 RepID=UPI00238A8839|nr:hypothetical protein L3040_006050 [Drepanopeziza brunnea f. sp. 'multigermtubi']
MTPRSSDSISTGTLTLLFSERGPLLLIQDPDLAYTARSYAYFAPSYWNQGAAKVIPARCSEPKMSRRWKERSQFNVHALAVVGDGDGLLAIANIQAGVGVDPGGGFSGAICDVDYASAISETGWGGVGDGAEADCEDDSEREEKV